MASISDARRQLALVSLPHTSSRRRGSPLLLAAGRRERSRIPRLECGAAGKHRGLADRAPGHGTRLGEDLVSDLGALLSEIVKALSPVLDRPFALFGHSLGGMLAFELARTLELRRGPTPLGVFISAAAAPRTVQRRPLHTLPRSALRAELRALGGTPLALLEAPEFDELFLPTLRADLALVYACAQRWEQPIAAPISALYGTTDPEAPKETVTAWAPHTHGGLELAEIVGGHFFLDTARADVLRILSASLARWSSREPT